MRWIPSWRLVAGVFLSVLGVMSLAALLFYANVAVPEPDRSAYDQTTYVYYDDGRTPIGIWSTVNRTLVPLKTVPDPVRNAVLSAEDRTFYTNKGVSITGLLRAAWSNSSGGTMQGGSTITQQYVKIVLLKDSSRTVSRKAKEFVIALKISRDKPKDEILENYLNAIYFGRGAYGIDAAARAYFGVTAARLTPSQGAYLAGIINGPNLYEPTSPTGLTRAKQRWTYVADGMVAIQAINLQERRKMVFPDQKSFAPRRQKTTAAGQDPQNKYLLQMVQDEMVNDRGYKEADLETKGYRITTTFNQKMISQAITAVRVKLGPRKKWPKGTQTALVTVDPKTGAVKAIYGGDGIRDQNAASQDMVQAGSTYKPFTLVAALEGDQRGADPPTDRDGGTDEDGTLAEGTPISLHSRFDGRSPRTFDRTEVRNYGGKSFGYIDLIKATQDSVNTVYVALNQQVGPAHTKDVAERAGVPKGTVKGNLVNVLGTDYPHPVDMASAYATFAAKGVYHKPYVVAEVTVPNGGRLCCSKPPGESRFSKDVMADATYAMEQVVKHGSGTYALGLGRPVAAKTGTTTGSRSAWFVGFTPQLTTAVALYRVGEKKELPLEGFQGFSDSQMVGGALPARVWTSFMSQALNGKEELDFLPPAWVGDDQNPAPETSPPTSSSSRVPRSVPTTDPSWPPTPPTVDPTPTQTGWPSPSQPTYTLPTGPSTRIRPKTRAP